ncbi:hypothetical protein [Brevundimonas sp.]|uniref:hypothetical protein n=1 Tax=Brevundimonas sp. TaxID=1871086 RepID=UPI0028AC5440|nr:hypothetical protein [Brevundimonas sp.]
MAEEIERLLVRVEANAEAFERQIKKMNRALYGSQAETRKTLNAIKKDWKDAGRDVANDFYRPIQLASTVALGAIVGFSLSAAKRAEAVDGAFKQVFRDMPDEAQAAVSAVANEFGRLETDVKDNFTQMRSVLTALGVDAEQSLKIVDQLQRRSLDIGAFANVEDAEAFRAVISGLTGETEPLKRFGIVVNETATKAELLRLGFKGNAEQASEGAKAIARANIIMRQSAEMHGQVARESDQLAEQEKRTRAEFTKAAEDFGRKFLPVAKDVLVWAGNALEAFNDLPGGVQNAGLALLAFVAASGPVGAAITGLRALIGAAVAARAALAAVAASGGAGAVAKGAAGAGLAATGAAGVAIGSTLALSGDTQRPGTDLQSQVTNALREEARVRGEITRLTNEGNTAEARRQQTYLSGIEQRRKRNEGLLELGRERTPSEAAAQAQRQAEQASKDALAQLGDFGLSQAQQRPGAGAGGGRGGSSGAAAAARQAERRDALALELAIAQARATGDEASIKAAEERQTLAQLTADYTDAGYADANAKALEHLALLNQAEVLVEERTKAEEQVDKIIENRTRQLEREADYQRLLNDQLLDALQVEAKLASLRGEEGAIRDAERRLYVEQRTNELLALRLSLTKEEAAARAGREFDNFQSAERSGQMRDEFRSAFSNGIRAAIDGDVGGFFDGLADRFTSRMLDNLADDLFDLLSNVGGDKKGGVLGSIASGIGSLFGGGRASGGPVTKGRIYRINENTPNSEYFAPGVSGSILTNGQVRGLETGGVRSGGGSLSVSVDVSGANGDEAVARIARQAAAEGTAQAIAQSRMDAANDRRASKYRLSGRG